MADKNLDEYQPLKFYKKNSKARQNGFAKFKDEKSHYFALYKDGDIAMLSQAYVNEAGRDNGIESVKKNSKLKKRYVFGTRSGGKHGFGLKAGNGQEIAISPNYGSKAAAEYAAGRLNGSVKIAKKKPTPQKATPKKTTLKKTAPKKKVVPAKAAPTKKKSANDEDNYRPLAFYNKHTKGRKKGIERFKGDDGDYYFAYFENDKIRLISEGYPTVGAQETGAASVEKNIKLAKRYDYRGPFKNGKYDYRLKAGNGKEIARSVWYGSAAAAATGAAYLMGTRKRVAPKPRPKKKSKVAPVVAAVAVATAAPAMAKAAKPLPPRDKDDDYLKCEEYHGHKVTDAENNLAFFSHANNKEYFVIYDDDGEVLIRSEGFESISKRSSELNAVLRLKDDPENFTRIEKNGYFMDVLKDENGREVGRSCLRKIAPPVAVAAPVAAAAAAVPAAAATGGMGWGWLKWLLPLLLLLLLGFFGLKGCSDGKAKQVAAEAAAAQKLAADKAIAAKKLAAEKAAAAKKLAAEKAAAVKAAAAAKAKEAAAVVTPPPAPKPVAPKPVAPKVTANLSRLCSASDSVLFNVPTYATPVSVGRLGTFPEFGDSHGLTPTQFYNKLASRHAANKFDQQYLDYLAKQLGYSNGFSDMSAADFSNETLAKGTKGLLGYGEFHGVAYSTLNVSSPRDLEAFRIRAANGTDIHFMKTCGNYMYVCN